MIAAIVGCTTLVLALIAAAVKMTSEDVLATLDASRRHEILAIKRTLARRFYRLAGLLSLALLSFPLIMDILLDFDPNAVPLRLCLWTLLPFVALWQTLGIIGGWFSLAGALRDPNVLSLRETLSLFFPTNSHR